MWSAPTALSIYRDQVSPDPRCDFPRCLRGSFRPTPATRPLAQVESAPSHVAAPATKRRDCAEIDAPITLLCLDVPTPP